MNNEYRFSQTGVPVKATLRLLTLFLGVVLGLPISATCTAADNSASTFPNRPVRLIVGFAPGGSADIIARIMAEKLAEDWKQVVVVDNRAGASGAIGADIVAKSAKDGYTLGIISATFTIVAAMGQKLPFDVAKDFSVVNRVVQVPFIVAVGNSPNLANAKTFADFLSVSRSKSRLVSYATGGAGSIGHLGSELLAAAAKVEFLHVPYKGTGGAMPDIISGRVDFTLSSVPEVIAQIRSKSLRALAVTSATRLPFLPDVPTVAESIPGLELENWFAFVGPSGIPRPILERLNADFGKAATSAKLKATWDEQSVTGTSYSLKEVEEHYRSELVRWDKIVKTLGLDKQAN